MKLIHFIGNVIYWVFAIPCGAILIFLMIHGLIYGVGGAIFATIGWVFIAPLMALFGA